MQTISNRDGVDIRAGKPRVVKLALCANHGYLTFSGECQCIKANNYGYERFAIIGTQYGWLHNTAGDVRMFKSDRAARHAMVSKGFAAEKARVFYTGDKNIECGGYFYSLENMKWDFADVVRVTPFSDADGPDNLYWVDRLTVNIREPGRELDNILATCGMDAQNLGRTATRNHVLIDCHLSYGAYDMCDRRVVQIGAKIDTPFHSSFGRINVDYVLRGNASLYKYARNVFLSGF